MTDTTPPSQVCPICAEPADGRNCCDHCLGRLDDNLAAIVVLTREAAHHLTPERRGGTPGTAKPGSRPPLDLASLDDAMACDAIADLEIIEREWRNHRQLTPYGIASANRGPTRTHELAAIVDFIRSQLALMAEDADWYGLHHRHKPDCTTPGRCACRCTCDHCTIRTRRGALNRHNPGNQPSTAWTLNCPGTHPDSDGRNCCWQLRVTPGTDDVIECPQCGTHWTAKRLVIAGLSDTTVTIWEYPAVIKEALGIAEGTLRKWYERGHIDRDGSRYNVGQAYRRGMDVA